MRMDLYQMPKFWSNFKENFELNPSLPDERF
jgi:hypothetical protein